MGSPARRIGPGKQHPFPLLLAQFNSHSAPATPCRHRPLGQLSARQPGLGRGRERGGASKKSPRPPETTSTESLRGSTPPPFSYHSARVTVGSANGDRAREKGRPGPDAPQESHAPYAGAAASSPGAPICRWAARAHVRPSRLPGGKGPTFCFSGNWRDCWSGFLSGGRWEMSRGRDILRQQVWLYGGPTDSAPELERGEKEPRSSRGGGEKLLKE